MENVVLYLSIVIRHIVPFADLSYCAQIKYIVISVIKGAKNAARIQYDSKVDQKSGGD